MAFLGLTHIVLKLKLDKILFVFFSQQSYRFKQSQGPKRINICSIFWTIKANSNTRLCGLYTSSGSTSLSIRIRFEHPLDRHGAVKND